MFHYAFLNKSRIKSDEGYSVQFNGQVITYRDIYGEYRMPYENGLLFSEQIYIEASLPNTVMNPDDRDLIVGNVLRTMEWGGTMLQVASPGMRASFDEES